MLYQYEVFVEVDEEISKARPNKCTEIFRKLIEKAIQTHKESKTYRLGWVVNLVSRT